MVEIEIYHLSNSRGLGYEGTDLSDPGLSKKIINELYVRQGRLKHKKNRTKIVDLLSCKM